MMDAMRSAPYFYEANKRVKSIKRRIMLSEKEVVLVYETLLSSPGMNEVVKVDMRMPRKQILLLAKVIEKGLLVKKGESPEGLFQVADTGISEQLMRVAQELLQKAGLSEMNEKLQGLQIHPGGK